MSDVFGIEFSTMDKNALVSAMADRPVPVGSGMRMVVTTNIDHVVNLLRDARFRAAYRSAWAATADGMPVALYARLRGASLPGRVAGPDLFASLMARLAPDRHRPFFLVSREDTGRRLQQWLVSKGFQPGSAVFVCPPFGFEHDDAVSRDLARKIRDHDTTHLFMGVGSPKSEVWMDDWHSELGDCYGFGIGAGVDYFVGTEVRAPIWMQKNGLEWFWRLASEPRRLWRRYATDALLFPIAILRDLTGSWSGPEPSKTISG